MTNYYEFAYATCYVEDDVAECLEFVKKARADRSPIPRHVITECADRLNNAAQVLSDASLELSLLLGEQDQPGML